MALKAILMDIDGTLMFRGEAIPGAGHALREARQAGFVVRLLTNITVRSPREIAGELRACGFDVHEADIQTAGTACSHYVRQRPEITCHLLVPDAMRGLFDGARINDVEPDLVIIGDIAERFDYATLNHAFRLLHNGARLVVPQKNLFWYDEAGPRLDSGAFILALEAASGQTALVTGKPSPVFFQAALDELGVSADEALIVGDDIHTDIAGARALGMRNVLVHTGKGKLQRSADGVAPAHELDSIANLMGFLHSAASMAHS
jgi:inorganic pyrophosphatase